MVADFERLECTAMQCGKEVRRIACYGFPQAGISWKTEFKMRGKLRQISVVLTECETPSLLRFRASSKGINVETDIGFLALSQRCTRPGVATSLGATMLPARQMLQSLKLG